MKQAIFNIFTDGEKHGIQELYATIATQFNEDSQDPEFQKKLRWYIDDLRRNGNIKNVSHGVWTMLSPEEQSRNLRKRMEEAE